MSDVVAFLRARLDEDEDYLRRAWPEDPPYRDDRVRREIEAHRRLLDEMAPDLAHDNGGPSTAHWTLGVLTSVWADHPDFDPDWDREGTE